MEVFDIGFLTPLLGIFDAADHMNSEMSSARLVSTAMLTVLLWRQQLKAREGPWIHAMPVCRMRQWGCLCCSAKQAQDTSRDASVNCLRPYSRDAI